MSTRPRLTDGAIRDLASTQSYERGSNYYAQGAVVQLALQGDQLLAEVQGSQDRPYQVRVTLGHHGMGIVSASCSCPYPGGGFCKHIVAVLLSYVHQPEQIAELISLETMLRQLDREKLLALLLEVTSQQPYLAELIAARVQDDDKVESQ